VQLARKYRSMGQTGAAMLQLQHAQKMVAHPTDKPLEMYESCDGKEPITEAHVLHEVLSLLVLLVQKYKYGR
jgi:hypothetical protein